jgi:hypothetical protein
MRRIESMRATQGLAPESHAARRSLRGGLPTFSAGLTTLALALCVGLVLCAGARATTPGQTVSLHASFIPDRLGTRVTVEFEFAVHSSVPGRPPAPVTNFDLHLPAGISALSSALGLANCYPAELFSGGPEGCPANSRVGFGSAIVAVPTELEPIEEEGSVELYVGPPNPEHLEILFYAEGHAPVSAQLVFPGHLLEDNAPFSGRLDTTVPLIPTWPGGPDLSVTRIASTIGPRGLTYYKHVRGKFVPFVPRGILLPRRCPRGGFPFEADLTFLTGAQAGATTVVPCPR